MTDALVGLGWIAAFVLLAAALVYADWREREEERSR